MPVGRQFVQILVRRWFEADAGPDGGPHIETVYNKCFEMSKLTDRIPAFIHTLADGITQSLLQGRQVDPEMMAAIRIAPMSDEQVVAVFDSQPDLESSITLEPATASLAPESAINESVVVSPANESRPTDSALSTTPKVQIVEDTAERAEERGVTLPRQTTKRIPKPDIQVVLRQEALDRARNHADEDRSRETGGVLLGRFIAQDESLSVVVTGIVRALRAVGRAASVEFTPEAWAEIWRKIDADPAYSDESRWGVVGWYHTHPRLGIFMSSMDLSIHQGHFTRPGHIALVIDPVHGDWGVFCWDRTRSEIVRCPQDRQKVLPDRLLIEMLSRASGNSLSELPAPEITSTSGSVPKTEGQNKTDEKATAVQDSMSEPASVGFGETRQSPTKYHPLHAGQGEESTHD